MLILRVLYEQKRSHFFFLILNSTNKHSIFSGGLYCYLDQQSNFVWLYVKELHKYFVIYCIVIFMYSSYA